ncbi:hypothetical protein [Halopiger goleimassiliensis]|uniref:hypothetical protein n=1 Tax=Halopiger goleimassiliensis TaxID=1293048 RepID=UPI000A7DDC10|nr:hypothetical protein [Halopiger goleimassiliensis]
MSIHVRKQADWMSKNDERILEYLCKNADSRPREIRDGLDDYGITAVARRKPTPSGVG